MYEPLANEFQEIVNEYEKNSKEQNETIEKIKKHLDNFNKFREVSDKMNELETKDNTIGSNNIELENFERRKVLVNQYKVEEYLNLKAQKSRLKKGDTKAREFFSDNKNLENARKVLEALEETNGDEEIQNDSKEEQQKNEENQENRSKEQENQLVGQEEVIDYSKMSIEELEKLLKKTENELKHVPKGRGRGKNYEVKGLEIRGYIPTYSYYGSNEKGKELIDKCVEINKVLHEKLHEKVKDSMNFKPIPDEEKNNSNSVDTVQIDKPKEENNTKNNELEKEVIGLRKQLTEKLGQILEQKKEIAAQKEEIAAQKEEIEKQKKEIAAQKEELEKQKEEIEKQKKEIAAQKEELEKQLAEQNQQQQTNQPDPVQNQQQQTNQPDPAQNQQQQTNQPDPAQNQQQTNQPGPAQNQQQTNQSDLQYETDRKRFLELQARNGSLSAEERKEINTLATKLYSANAIDDKSKIKPAEERNLYEQYNRMYAPKGDNNLFKNIDKYDDEAQKMNMTKEEVIAENEKNKDKSNVEVIVKKITKPIQIVREKFANGWNNIKSEISKIFDKFTNKDIDDQDLNTGRSR